MANGPSLIETYNIVKRYSDTVAVKNVTFDMQAGEVFGFLGQNGAGNIALSRMIAGLEKPDRGSTCNSETVKLVYADQIRLLDDEKNIWEEIRGGEEELTLCMHRMNLPCK
jgi:ABC-type multidrug transport system ATPase subunit